MIDFGSLQMNGPAGLRAIASRDFGITGVKNYSKAALVEMLEGIVAKQERDAEITATKKARSAKIEALKVTTVTPIVGEPAEIVALLQDTAKAAKPAKPAKARKVCTICQLRPRGAEAKQGGHPEYCDACYIEAGWENTHSDQAHEEIAAYDSADKAGVEAPFDERAMMDERTVMARCWICQPQLNEASKDYQPKSGTSRAGMKLSVPVRAEGVAKAATTKARLDAAGIASEIKAKKSTVRLVVESGDMRITLAWAATGAYLYEESSVIRGGKARKVRNVKAALGLLGVKI